MEHIDIACRTLSRDDLQAYIPDDRFFALRELWSDSDSKPKIVVVRISVQNTGECPLSIVTDNLDCKFELQNLRVMDSCGQHLLPERNLSIRPKESSPSPENIKENCNLDFDLVGEVLDGFLIFPGAKFLIPDDGVLKARFSYKGTDSEVFALLG